MTQIQERSVRVGQHELAYLEAGEGPLVVLVHGFPDNAWSFEYQIPALAAAGFRAVAPFLRGYPPSEIPAEPDFTAEALGSDLNGLIAALSDAKAFVAGHDFGAMAVYAALAQPEHRIARASVLAVSHPANFARLIQHPALIQHGFHIWFFAHPLVGEIGAVHNDMALIDYLWARWSGNHDDSAHAERVKRETLSKRGALAAAVSYYRSFVGNGPALAERLRDPIEVPMLAIYGADDPVPQVLAPGEEARYGGEYRRADIADAHHFVHRHQPDAVNRLLIEWFTSPAREGAGAVKVSA